MVGPVGNGFRDEHDPEFLAAANKFSGDGA